VTRAAQTIAGALLLTTAMAGCATTTAGSGSIAADVPAAGTPTTLPVPDGSSTAPAPTGTPAATTPAPTVAGGRRIQVGSVSVPVPAGAGVRTNDAYLCVILKNGGPRCSLEVIDIKAQRAGGASLGNPEPGAQYGWWWGSDVPSCEEGGVVSPITRETVVTKGFKKVGDKNAVYGDYLVSCENSDLDFDPRIWWLPTSQIAFRQPSGVAGTSEAVAPILAAVTFSS
jgi:hypothetical protein